MAELLLELLSEEIPARMQARAADDLKRLAGEKLSAAGLKFAEAAAFVTPRRLALVVTGLPQRTADATEERKGPRVGSPEQAIQGFLKSAGLASLEQCEKREVGPAEFWFAVTKRKGVETAAVLPGLLVEAIRALPWPKSMRFADASLRWVRPLHGVLALFDGKVLPGALARGGSLKPLEFDDGTRGHRFLAPRPFKVRDFADYRGKLKAAHVILDREERKTLIRAELVRLAGEHGLTLKDDIGLMEEVAGLVEWPVVFVGRVDPDYIDLPPEVLATAMRANQKYFTLMSGHRITHFAVVANIPAADGGRAIVAGNERVLRARLADAKFFWDQDRKIELEDRLPSLRDVVFHAKLGSLADKAERLKALAPEIAKFVPACDAVAAAQAAHLCKADLVSGMVGEFPELQGIMGRYYAKAEGIQTAVADAIGEHYAPLGPNDRCPSAPVSVAAALADKIDTLVGFFAVGEKPTGSKDPFALRRAALGVIRLVVENKLRVNMSQLFGHSVAIWKRITGQPFEKHLQAALNSARPQDADIRGPMSVAWDVYYAAGARDFMADRLKVALKDTGVRHDLIAAVFALPQQDDIVDMLARVDALNAFLDTEDGTNLLVAYRRAANIVRIEEKKDSATYDGAPDAGLVKMPEEKTLAARLEAVGSEADKAIKAEKYPAAMSALSGLRAPVDAFFDKVTVNTDDARLRANRLRLLNHIRHTMDRVADFSRIEG